MKEYRGMHVSASEPRRYRIGGEELSKEHYLGITSERARRTRRILLTAQLCAATTISRIHSHALAIAFTDRRANRFIISNGR